MVITIKTSLEQIVFEDQKILRKSDGSEIKSLRPIGVPVIIGDINQDKEDEDDFDIFKELDFRIIYIDKSAPNDANAYCIGDENLLAGHSTGIIDTAYYGNPVQYYRID
jgi:hypothetical protein